MKIWTTYRYIVIKYAKEFNEKYDDARLEISFDFISLLQSRLSLLYKNGGYGLLLVVIFVSPFSEFSLIIVGCMGNSSVLFRDVLLLPT